MTPRKARSYKEEMRNQDDPASDIDNQDGDDRLSDLGDVSEMRVR